MSLIANYHANHANDANMPKTTVIRVIVDKSAITMNGRNGGKAM